VVGLGAWSDYFNSWSSLAELLQNNDLVSGEVLEKIAGPKPQIIPANERRRAPLPVRLAVESSCQASQMANIDPKDLSCVFVSGFGDTQLTDYMCSVLASESKELSPTKFHNSVHNAAAGYWTISTGCQQAANSVAGFQHSVALTLMEGILQCVEENKPVLLTFFDAPVTAMLTDILGQGNSFSFALIVVPDNYYSGHDYCKKIKATIKYHRCEWPNLAAQNNTLIQYYMNNPSARILPFLEVLLGLSKSNAVEFPLSEQTSLSLAMV
jgi:hypothetical protein